MLKSIMGQGTLTLGETIARGNPEGANDFLAKYGFAPTKSLGEAVMRINRTLLTHGEQALTDALKAHPDYQHIKEVVIEEETERGTIVKSKSNISNNFSGHSNCCGNFSGPTFSCNNSSKAGFSNCSGCGGTCGNKSMSHFNVDGGAGNQQQIMSDSFGKQAFWIIVGVSAIFGLVLLAQKDKKSA